MNRASRRARPKIVRKPDDYQSFLYGLMQKPVGVSLHTPLHVAPRGCAEIVTDLIRLYDTLLALVETDETFDAEKNARIMERYDALKLEFWRSVGYAKSRGISLRGLRKMIPFEV